MNNKNKMYYSLVQNEDSAVLNIFGDICSFAYEPAGEMSSYLLSKKLEELGNVSVIDVYINSYGGEVAEGLAIYNALKRHKAKIRTHVDGFACSIASVIFMAGDERIMPTTSCLMIHNPYVFIVGNSSELRKQAEDLDKIGQCSINAYMEHVNITLERLKELLDNETWISPQEALEMGFATSNEEDGEEEHASQSVKKKIINMALNLNVKDECNSNSTFEVSSTDEEEQKDNSNQEENLNVDTNSDKTSDEEMKESDNVDGVENPNEKAIKMVALFLKNLEKEMLK